jgi:RNA polymerase sigma-70 factor, ECF subfamily
VSDLEPADAELLQAMGREPQAIALLHDRHARRLVAYLQRHGATDEAALDAAQETFARLIVRHRRVRVADDGSLWPWLAVTARNLVRDWQRRGAVDARARRRLGLPVALDESDEATARIDATRLQGRLRRGLARLPDDQRDAITAHVVEERGYPEIAATTGATEEAIRSRVSRGLRALHTFLEGGHS